MESWGAQHNPEEVMQRLQVGGVAAVTIESGDHLVGKDPQLMEGVFK